MFSFFKGSSSKFLSRIYLLNFRDINQAESFISGSYIYQLHGNADKNQKIKVPTLFRES